MKFSRDPSREFLGNRATATRVIEEQVSHVAQTGATHIAISTPYDAEFLPLLEQWVAEARKHNLKVWFRGNWSGWEGWFGYSKITAEDHLTKTTAFIKDNPNLFEDGDIFSGCPECENGGPGDPRMTDGKVRHQQFLIKQYQSSKAAFKDIGKDVDVSYHSMNGDVARLVMDKPTTAAAGGKIVVDHYVRTPEQLVTDIIQYGKQSDGKVVLGEFGAPIPDIHGNMTEKQQAEWLEQALSGLAKSGALYGLNYWTGMGGSTAIWNSDGSAREAVAVLRKYFKPEIIQATVVATNGNHLKDVAVTSQYKKAVTDDTGAFALPYLEKTGNVIFSKDGYTDKVYPFAELQSGTEIVLEPLQLLQTDGFKSFIKWLFSFFS
jgi:hypothetical protein